MLDRPYVAHAARWLVAFVWVCCAHVARADTAVPIAQQRQLYIQALEDADAGRIDAFRAAMSQLVDYPLYPYLVYQDHRRRLEQLSGDDVIAFGERWSDSPLAGRLFQDWLDDLSDRSAWPQFIEYYPRYVEKYKPTNDAERQCTYLRALDRAGHRTEAMEQVRPLWMVGTTQPKACEPLFAVWVGLPLKQTIATSLACVGIFAIPGTITHAVQGDINWSYAVALALGVIPGAQIGARFTIASDDRTLRYTVGAALGIIAVIYAAGEISALF